MTNKDSPWHDEKAYDDYGCDYDDDFRGVSSMTIASIFCFAFVIGLVAGVLLS